MTTRLIDKNWGRELAALARGSDGLRIICPFIKLKALERLLVGGFQNIQVITRFNLRDFAGKVSDVSALQRLLDEGAGIRGIKNLHTKLYVFGDEKAVITSANLTGMALEKNHEFGMVSGNKDIVLRCNEYFDYLWERGNGVSRAQLDKWNKEIMSRRTSGGPPQRDSGYKDYGADSGYKADSSLNILGVNPGRSDEPRAFVKFDGNSESRFKLSYSIMDEIKSSGCHQVLCYPNKLRPRLVQDDSVMFIACLTEGPGIRVIGRAIGWQHNEKRDNAKLGEIKDRPWKKKYQRYIRVHSSAFIDGVMEDGVSLYEMMAELGAFSYATTKYNEERGKGNISPKRAIMQKAGIMLSHEGWNWLSKRLDKAFREKGCLTVNKLKKVKGLDWPNEKLGLE